MSKSLPYSVEELKELEQCPIFEKHHIFNTLGYFYKFNEYGNFPTREEYVYGRSAIRIALPELLKLFLRCMPEFKTIKRWESSNVNLKACILAFKNDADTPEQIDTQFCSLYEMHDEMYEYIKSLFYDKETIKSPFILKLESIMRIIIQTLYFHCRNKLNLNPLIMKANHERHSNDQPQEMGQMDEAEENKINEYECYMFNDNKYYKSITPHPEESRLFFRYEFHKVMFSNGTLTVLVDLYSYITKSEKEMNTLIKHGGFFGNAIEIQQPLQSRVYTTLHVQ